MINWNDEKQFGKFTFFLFVDDKRVSLSLELILVQYLEALHFFETGNFYASKRHAIIDLTDQIQSMVDQYYGHDYQNVSMSAYVKLYVLSLLLEYDRANELKTIIPHVKIQA